MARKQSKRSHGKRNQQKDPEQEKKVQEVNDYFEGKSKLEILQEMCYNLFGEQPDSASGCKKLLRPIYINIYDYVDGYYQFKFDTWHEFRDRCEYKGVFSLEKGKKRKSWSVAS